MIKRRYLIILAVKAFHSPGRERCCCAFLLRSGLTLHSIVVLKRFHSFQNCLAPVKGFITYEYFYIAFFLPFKSCRGLVVHSARKRIVSFVGKSFPDLAIPFQQKKVPFPEK